MDWTAYQKPVFLPTVDDESTGALAFDELQQLGSDHELCRVAFPVYSLGFSS